MQFSTFEAIYQHSVALYYVFDLYEKTHNHKTTHIWVMRKKSPNRKSKKTED